MEVALQYVGRQRHASLRVASNCFLAVLRPDAEPAINAGVTPPFVDGTHNNHKSRVRARYSFWKGLGFWLSLERPFTTGGSGS
jgi:hypothetical protein